MIRSIGIIYLIVITILIGSCKKSSEDNSQKIKPDIGSFSYHRLIVYDQPTASKELLITNRGDTNVVAVLNSKHLLISFYTKPFSDDISFEVGISNLASEVTGNYQIRTKDVVAGVGNANYIYNFYNLQTLQHSFITLGSSFTGDGVLTISSYDLQGNTISGSFQLVLNNVPDPTIDVIDGGAVVTQNCSLKIEGSFQNVLLHN